MKQTLHDFSFLYNYVPIKCENISAMNVSIILVQHVKAKLIEIKHCFLRDHAQKHDITLGFVSTNYQLVDIFIKTLNKDSFITNKRELDLIKT